MQRKPGYPVANCNIKMPDSVPLSEAVPCDDDSDQQHRRQQLINFGHAQWGFNNWSWTVNKQDLDFVDFANGKYCCGVAAFVCVSVKSFDIRRENVGYATCTAHLKGSAIHQARKCAVTNALRETLLSFGGSVATELMEMLDAHRVEPVPVPVPVPVPAPVAPPLLPEPQPENNQNLANKDPNTPLPKNIPRKEDANPVNMRHPLPPAIKNVVHHPPPVAKALPMPANLPPAANRPPVPGAPRPPAPRPNSNVSFVLQPVMGGVVPPLYAPQPRMPHVAPPHIYPNYYEYGPWHFTYESYDRHHGNVNLNFNIPPKNLVVNGRSGSVECKNACGVRPNGPEGEPLQYHPPQNQGCWIKPTIFYDGFWTEQKVKKWVAEQVEKQFPEDASQKSTSPSNSGQPDPKS
ncbi:uncharacterized protein LOC134749506 [Cydia strobilella]|uniref:uncharacterized protein LOC134749506 n=1 Tax=Cydia strobilella TaxID=1100964 RepID=UPI003004236F